MYTEGTPHPQKDWSPARDCRSGSGSIPMASRMVETAKSLVSGMLRAR